MSGGPGTATVPEGAAGERLDRFLAEHLGRPRNQIQRWIRDGRVTAGGRTARAAHPLTAGEELAWEPPPPPEARLLPEEGPIEVLFEDDALIALDKPAGLAVHPGAGRPTGTLAHRLLARYPELEAVGGPGRPGIVHRLDKDTTGVLVVARTEEAYHRLAAAFAERRVQKTYLAVVYGRPRSEEGRIEAPIARHRQRRQEMTVDARGRPARTDYRLLGAAPGVSLLEVDLRTGRTHQIRVHCKALGHPLVGDPVYGEARWKGLPPARRGPLKTFPRPALHAWRIALEHPASGEPWSCAAPLPADLMELWETVTEGPLPVA